jgi:hypothetical protein
VHCLKSNLTLLHLNIEFTVAMQEANSLPMLSAYGLSAGWVFILPHLL